RRARPRSWRPTSWPSRCEVRPAPSRPSTREAMMRELRTAESRLNRVLYLLPVCFREDGATVDELAAALGVDPSIVLEDIQEVTTRAFYPPAGSGDALQVSMEGDRVRVWTTGDFRRPPRLSPRETLALGLGLRAVAAEASPERRHELLGL